MKLDSSVAAIVTGGASGLGAATARALAAKGVKVAIFDLQAEKGEPLPRKSAASSAKPMSPATRASTPLSQRRARRTGRSAFWSAARAPVTR